MPSVTIILDEPAWPELRDNDRVVHLEDPHIAIAALAGGMTSGKTSVAIRIDLPDGAIVIAETSLAVMVAAVRGIAAKYEPELFDRPIER